MAITERVLPAPAPFVLPEVKQFWDATAEGRLLLPKCQDCGTVLLADSKDMDQPLSFRENWGSAHPAGAAFLFVDGSVRRVRYTADPAAFVAALTPAGGEPAADF